MSLSSPGSPMLRKISETRPVLLGDRVANFIRHPDPRATGDLTLATK